MSGALVGIALAAAYRSRRKEPFHALDVPGRSAITCVHVTATNPFRAGRHPDLVTHAIVTDHRSRGVRAVSLVVARERRIIPARIARCYHGWSRASCNRDRHSFRPSRDSAA